ncbi:MAG: polysaccharide deacetylase family protein [Xanthobacteraceae bacterium]
MTMTTLKHLAIVTALLAGGTSLAMIGFLTAQQIIARQASAPGSTPTAQHSTPADQIGKAGASVTVAPPVASVQEAQPAPAPPKGPAQTGSAKNSLTRTTSAIPPCDKPDGLGLSRIVQIDTTGGPEFGAQHLRGYDFLRDKEVVLTFDDGPWPGSTEAVLQALADQCLKATFFEIGEHASWHPQITKQVVDAGMTVGTHTWSHKDLARNPYASDPEKAEWEIEMGNSAVHSAAAGGNVAPFFRFPDLQTPPQLLSYFAERNIAIFSTDIDSRDFTMHKPEQVVNSVMTQLEKRGKGIVLLHDFHRNTAAALPKLLRQLKLAGYKVVHLVPKEQLTTVPKYDEMFEHRENLSSSAQPASATAPANVAAAHHRGSMYMYVPAQGRSTHAHKKATTGTTGAN